MGVAKQYERDMLHSLRTQGVWVERFVDKVYGEGRSLKSPPDLIGVKDGHSYLIECKSVKGKSLPNANVSDHQIKALLHHRAHGGSSYLAILYYNGKRGKATLRETWLVPIKWYTDYFTRYPRKSLSLLHLQGELDPLHRAEWVGRKEEVGPWRFDERLWLEREEQPMGVAA
jgi:Holliday junction resolvase